MKNMDGTAIGRTPRWVKVQGTLVALLILVVVTMLSGLLGGYEHGGGMRHGAERGED